ncbi:MAG: hypothetical protein LBT44_06000 [Clostridiales bacterium]|jgi:hypothetical protein|nr:hypothetical protein [Clostridiales bacterium]
MLKTLGYRAALKSFEETSEIIHSQKALSISGTETLLRKLPKGNWIGGSTEYFIGEDGGVVTDDKFFVQELDFDTVKIKSYDEKSLSGFTADAYDNGFAIIILPFDSEVHKSYARHAADYKDIFLKSVVGWISGINLDKAGQTPITVNGLTGEVYNDKAVVMFVDIPDDQNVLVNIINIFTPDEKSPIITFDEEGFKVRKCNINGKHVNFMDYISDNKLDTKLPLIGDYSGAGINISIKNMENGEVSLYAPVFKGIEYRFAKPMPDYEAAFRKELQNIENKDSVFACNCILNFLYGDLEGKKINGLYGPITFGEIAWQLVNQTLVYLRIV